MASKNLESVRRIFEDFPEAQHALRKGEFPMGPPMSEEIEWDASDLGLPDIGDGHMRGHEGIRRFWMAWLSAWEEITFDYELLEAGTKVVAIIEQRNRGSEIELPTLRYAQVWTFEDAEVVHWKLFMDPGAALESAGLAT